MNFTFDGILFKAPGGHLWIRIWDDHLLSQPHLLFKLKMISGETSTNSLAWIYREILSEKFTRKHSRFHALPFALVFKMTHLKPSVSTENRCSLLYSKIKSHKRLTINNPEQLDFRHSATTHHPVKKHYTVRACTKTSVVCNRITSKWKILAIWPIFRHRHQKFAKNMTQRKVSKWKSHASMLIYGTQHRMLSSWHRIDN